jgi:hypothetical protein
MKRLAFIIKAKHVHDTKVTGTNPAKVLAIWIVKERPALATPAP